MHSNFPAIIKAKIIAYLYCYDLCIVLCSNACLPLELNHWATYEKSLRFSFFVLTKCIFIHNLIKLI